MKKAVMAVAALVTAAAPILTAAPAAAQGGDRHWRDDDDRRDRDGRRGDRRRDRDWRDDDRRDGDWRRGDRRDRWDRDDRRDHRRAHRRWARREHNGYYYRDRWFYGPPPSAYYSDPYFRPGWRSWRRGERLPSYYRSQYVVVRDYDRYGLRYPPRGYHWVRDDRGDYLLVGIATGVILGLILGSSGY